MTILASVCAAAFAAAVAVVAWPRRRDPQVSGVRWERHPETGLREYYATPWMQGDKR